MRHFYSHDESVLGYGDAADDDVRVMRQIEERAREKNTGVDWNGNFKDNLF